MLTNRQAHLRAARVIFLDYVSSLVRGNLRPYWARRETNEITNSGLTDINHPYTRFFFSPSAAVRHVKGAPIGQGRIGTRDCVWVLTRQAGVRANWVIPAPLRVRLGHQNASVPTKK